MKSNYRIVFHDGPEGHNSKNVDVYAESSSEAMKMAYQMPEAKMLELYSELYVEKIPQEPSVIGVEFEYTSPYLSGMCAGYLFIKANDEAEATRYYNEHYRCKCFSGADYGKNAEDSAHNVRGRIRNTYFAGKCMGFDADATVPEKQSRLDEKILKADQEKLNNGRSLSQEKGFDNIGR